MIDCSTKGMGSIEGPHWAWQVVVEYYLDLCIAYMGFQCGNAEQCWVVFALLWINTFVAVKLSSSKRTTFNGRPRTVH